MSHTVCACRWLFSTMASVSTRSPKLDSKPFFKSSSVTWTDSPTSFLRATDGQTASRTYRSTVVASCSVIVFSQRSTSGLPSCLTIAVGLGRPGHFAVDVPFLDGLGSAAEFLRQQPAIDLALQHLLAVPVQAFLRQLRQGQLAAVDQGGHARVLLLQLRVVVDVDDLGLLLQLLE